MKVCLLNDSFPPVLDGVANVVINYAKYLPTDFGSPVIVGTPRYPDADYTAYPYPVIPYQSFGTESLASGYRTGNPFAGKAVSEMAAFQPDIIHAHCPASATIIARLLRDEVKAPIVFTYHTKYDIDLRRVIKVKAAAEETIKAMVGNISACDDIWVVSRGAGESLSALGFEGEWHVMDNGVDFEKGRVDRAAVEAATAGYDLPENVPMFLFVGRMMTYKGIPMILDALKILSDAGQDFRMVFIGKGPDKELMENKAREYGFMDDNDVPGKCIFTGAIYDRNVLRAWNTRADLFIFPSTFDTNGLVVREAAACGLASVLIEGSCAAEGVTPGRNGFTVEENAASLGAFLIEASRDLPHLRDVGQHAMDEIYLSWRDAVAKAYDRYLWVLDQNAQGRYDRKWKDATDVLVSLTARSMSESARYRRIRTEIFNDWKESAVGMMENIQEAGENVEDFLDKLTDGISDSYEDAIANAQRSFREREEKSLQARHEREEKLREAQKIFDEKLDAAQKAREIRRDEARKEQEIKRQQREEKAQERREARENAVREARESLEELSGSIKNLPSDAKESLDELSGELKKTAAEAKNTLKKNMDIAAEEIRKSYEELQNND